MGFWPSKAFDWLLEIWLGIFKTKQNIPLVAAAPIAQSCSLLLKQNGRSYYVALSASCSSHFMTAPETLSEFQRFPQTEKAWRSLSEVFLDENNIIVVKGC